MVQNNFLSPRCQPGFRSTANAPEAQVQLKAKSQFPPTRFLPEISASRQIALPALEAASCGLGRRLNPHTI